MSRKTGMDGSKSDGKTQFRVITNMTSKPITIPLLNFRLNDSRVCQLGTDRIEYDDFPFSRNGMGKLYYRFMLKVMPKNDNKEDYRQAFDRGIITLKLFKDEFILANSYQRPDNRTVEINYFIPWGIVINRPYSILPSEKQKLRKFWETFKDIDTKNFAVSRFHLAEYRPKDNDRFLDYVLALENLLTPKSSPDEPISYKFRLSGALCLEKNDGFTVDKRLDLFKNIYALRSRIVHGGGDVLTPLKNIRKQIMPNESKMDREAILRGKNERLKWEIPIETAKGYVKEAILLFHSKKLLSNDGNRRDWIEKKILKSS